MRPGLILVVSFFVVFLGGFFVDRPLELSHIPKQGGKQLIRLQDSYLISSELNFGRLSNLKISIAEVIGLSIALNRTAVLPKLESCIKSTEDLGWSGITEFDQLYDSSAFSRATIVSSSFLDLG